MRAGNLRHYVVIQKNIPVKDDTGALKDAWSTFANAWAAIWPLSGKEVLSGFNIEGQVSHRVRLRYVSGITSSMRILHDGRTLNIVSPPINKDERNIYIELLCEEVS